MKLKNGFRDFSPHTLKANALQLRLLLGVLGNLDIGEVTLQLLKENKPVAGTQLKIRID